MKRVLLTLALLWSAAWSVQAGERVEPILSDQAERGFRSPVEAMARLEAAVDRPGPDASVEARRRYHAALGTLAVLRTERGLAERYLRPLRELGDQGCTRCRAQYLIRSAESLVWRDELDEAGAALRQADLLIRDDDRELAMEMAVARGRWLGSRGDYASAVRAATRASRLAREVGNTGMYLRAQAQLVVAHAHLGELVRAKRLAAAALPLATDNGFVYMQAHLGIGIAYVHLLLDELDLQRAALLEVLRVARLHPGLEELELNAVVNLGAHHAALGHFPAALEYSQRAEELAIRLDRGIVRAVALTNGGIALAGTGRVDEGIRWITTAYELAETAGSQGHMAGISRELATVQAGAGRYRDAYRALRRSEAIEAGITRQAREKAVHELQARYSAERRSREIERLRTQNRIREAGVAARAWQQWLWVVIAVVFALAALLLSGWVRRARSTARRLADRHAALAAEAVNDPLTGVYNRLHCQNVLTRHGERVRNGGAGAAASRIGLVLIDVDHFKTINDRFGHGVGDAVLVEIARRLRALLRARDSIVRWGGEEFLLMLPDTGPDGMRVLVERVLHAIGGTVVSVDGGLVPATVSSGAIVWPAYPGQSWQDALHRADLALYQAKARGRNRAVCITHMATAEADHRIADDLAEAAEQGDVELATVAGPPLASAGDAAAHARGAAIAVAAPQA